MASENQMNQLKNVANTILDIDENRLLRPGLGEESLKEDFPPKLMKILRAQLHMCEKNRHRQRVANSMEAFVASAVTPEQRDLILSQLVESVVQFGNSGLVQREDDHAYRPRMTIDSINRNLSTMPQKDV